MWMWEVRNLESLPGDARAILQERRDQRAHGTSKIRTAIDHLSEESKARLLQGTGADGDDASNNVR